MELVMTNNPKHDVVMILIKETMNGNMNWNHNEDFHYCNYKEIWFELHGVSGKFIRLKMNGIGYMDSREGVSQNHLDLGRLTQCIISQSFADLAIITSSILQWK